MIPEITAADFFTPLNTIDNIDESAYANADILIEAAKAFERCTYQCVYIIDYHKKGFLYVSNNISLLCGCKSEHVKETGCNFYITHVPGPDLQILLELNEKGYDLFYTFPIDDRKSYTLSYDFHIMDDSGKRLVNHKITPLALTPDDRIWLALCTISLSAANCAGNAIMKKNGSTISYLYNSVLKEWNLHEEMQLSDTERKVLALSTRGYTMRDIAAIMCKSEDMVKSCKQRIFRKTNAKNIAEALTHAQNHQQI